MAEHGPQAIHGLGREAQVGVRLQLRLRWRFGWDRTLGHELCMGSVNGDGDFVGLYSWVLSFLPLR